MLNKTSKDVSDILLAFCPPRKAYYPPIEIAYLATNLKLNGFKVEICDLNNELFHSASHNQRHLWQKINEHLWQNPEKVNEFFEIMKDKITQLINDILISQATVIHFNIEYPNEIFTCRLLRILKERKPQQTIIAGGTGCCTLEQRKDLLSQSTNTIDYFVVGDGEHIVADILKACRDKDDPAEIPGVVAAQYSLAKFHPAQPIDLDNIAYPTFEEFDISSYKKKCLAVRWSRGCTEYCLFCRKRVSDAGYRFRSVTSIIDELHYHIEKYGVHDFVVSDLMVNGSPNHLEHICDAIMKSSIKISWSAKAIPLPSLTKRLLDKMHKAGCHTLVFCIVSGSDDILSKMGNSMKIKTAEEVIRRTHGSGIKVAINIVVGFPGEYNCQFEETLEFLRRNPQPLINHLYITSTLQVPKGTPLHQQANQFGLILPANEPQKRWYTLDGNTYDIRQQRQQEVLHLSLSLRIEAGHTYLKAPRKEHGFLNKFNPIYRWRRFLYHTYRGHESSDAVNNNLYSKILARIVSRLTLISTAKETDIPLIESIRDGSRSSIGPEVVHLDLTNRCNMNCIACWNQSPFVVEGTRHDDFFAKLLPYKAVKDLIDDLIQLRGMHRLKLGGGGEPIMHPKFKEILAYIRSKDKYIEIEINTNFSLVDEKLIKLMIDLKVDLLTVSLWAGTPTVYKRTHPNQSEKTFNRIVDNLKTMVKMRKNGFPRISIHNVIMNLNYHDVDAMMELALDIGADEINFVLIDPVPGKTEHLLLNHEERMALIKILKRIKQRIDRFIIYVEPLSGHTIRVANMDELLQKLSQSTIEKGIYDKKPVDKIPCYIGWIYTRIMADGKVAPCCKGHRLPMGTIYKNRFKEIWNSPRYIRFRRNGITLKKTDPYFSVMGNDITSQTGCYNCDNIMHNLVMHEKFLFHSYYYKWVQFELSKWISGIYN